jgi:hypothetical protein
MHSYDPNLWQNHKVSVDIESPTCLGCMYDTFYRLDLTVMHMAVFLFPCAHDKFEYRPYIPTTHGLFFPLPKLLQYHVSILLQNKNTK